MPPKVEAAAELAAILVIAGTAAVVVGRFSGHFARRAATLARQIGR